MNQQNVLVKEVEGKPLPEYILFNSSGQGYGVFPVDKNMHAVERLQNPLMRASAYINLYENMLNGNVIRPEELLFLAVDLLALEKEELTSSLLAGYITDIYWRLVSAAKRKSMAESFAKRLWNMLKTEPSSNKKKIIFRSYQNVALTNDALDTLYHIWKKKDPPPGVKLSEDDYTLLSLNLTLKEYPDTSILPVQQNRITNPDRKQRLQFLQPALSADVKTRDTFFESLKDSSIRKKEAWVQDALAYLHHPLRAATSVRYLKQSLDLLQEVQRTGDIFFPAAWLSTTFGAYQTGDAAAIVRKFLKMHPDYNPKMKAKILQAADPLFRAGQLVKQQ